MENPNPNRNRNIWIIVIAAIVGLLLVCLLIGAAVVFITGAWGVTALRDRGGMGPARVTEQTQQVFDVEPGATLEVDNFAGNITVRTGPTGQIMLTVTRRAGVPADLARIEVNIRDELEGLQIRTSQPTGRPGNWSVEFAITVPPDTVLDLDTGAGNVVVEGVEGEIASRTGAGNVTVRDAMAPVTLRTGAGNISYEGDPSGLCTFDTGAGNITLRLPADAEVALDLNSGVGNIELGGFEVAGEVSRSRVSGVIGSGEQATIEADASVGNIVLVQR
jgi:hypothetical protein